MCNCSRGLGLVLGQYDELTIGAQQNQRRVGRHAAISGRDGRGFDRRIADGRDRDGLRDPRDRRRRW